MKKRVISALWLLIAGLPVAPAVAAESGPGTPEDSREPALEEVTVTARRRLESARDVPISMVTKTGEALEQSHVASMTELDRVVPGFTFKEFEMGGQSTMGIRGLSTFSQTGAQQSVGMVVDGVVLEAIGTAVTDFNDVDHIEVLRGPQGTLFGKNTTGGVVHILTKDPSDTFDAHVSLGYGSYDEVKWNGTVSGPLSEHVAARVSAFSLNRGGYVENINDGRMLGTDEQVGVRTKFLYTPREGTKLKLGFYYVDRHQKGLSSGNDQPIVGFGPFTPAETIADSAGIAGPKNNKVNGVGQHPFDDKIRGINLTWDQAFGEYMLTSISSFEHWRWDFGAHDRTFNPPTPPKALVKFFAANDQDAWSQEVRLASPTGRFAQYVVGAFASGVRAASPINFLINLVRDPNPAAAIYLIDDEVQVGKNLNYSAFGESDFHLTKTFTLTTGVRWTHDERKASTNAQPPPGYIPEDGIGIGSLGQLYIPFLGSEVPGYRQDRNSAEDVSWRGGLRWQPNRSLMLYGSAARGFKGPAISSISGTFTRVKPEIATSFEVGVKGGLFGDRLVASLAAYHVDVDDFQAEGTNSIKTANGTIISIVLKNAGKMRSQGLEFELTALPTEHLQLNVGAAYIDAKYVSFKGASCYESQTEAEGCTLFDPEPLNPDNDPIPLQDLSGKRLPFTAKFSGSGSANYEFALPVWQSLKEYVRLDYTYEGPIQWNLGIAPLNETRATGVWGLSLGIEGLDNRVEVVGYVKNLTNKFVVNGLNGGNEAILANLQPDYRRTYGVTFNYSFR